MFGICFGLERVRSRIRKRLTMFTVNKKALSLSGKIPA